MTSSRRVPASPKPGSVRLVTLRMSWELSRRIDAMIKAAPSDDRRFDVRVLRLLEAAADSFEAQRARDGATNNARTGN